MTPELAKALEFFDKNIGAVRGDDTVPKGFFTAKQMAYAKGLSAASAEHIKAKWDQFVESGLAERRILKVGRHRASYYKGKE